jgi:hypothetical protein
MKLKGYLLSTSFFFLKIWLVLPHIIIMHQALHTYLVFIFRIRSIA